MIFISRLKNNLVIKTRFPMYVTVFVIALVVPVRIVIVMDILVGQHAIVPVHAIVQDRGRITLTSY
jgi:hypothetical protein